MKSIAIAVFAFAAGVLVYDISADFRAHTAQIDGQRVMAGLREECKAPDGWIARVLLDSETAHPYCMWVKSGKRYMSMVKPMRKVEM